MYPLLYYLNLESSKGVDERRSLCAACGILHGTTEHVHQCIGQRCHTQIQKASSEESLARIPLWALQPIIASPYSSAFNSPDPSLYAIQP